MMLRYAGIFLLAATIIAAGQLRAAAYKRSAALTSAFAALIDRLRGMIEFDRSELGAIWQSCAGLSPLPGFTERAAELGFSAALELYAGENALEPALRGLLDRLGDTLGKTTADDQLRALERTGAELRRLEAEQRSALGARLKLCRTLSVSAALAAALLLA